MKRLAFLIAILTGLAVRAAVAGPVDSPIPVNPCAAPNNGNLKKALGVCVKFVGADGLIFAQSGR